MSSPTGAAPFRLSLSPASVRLVNGKTHYNGAVKVTDSGSAPLHVQMTAITLAPVGGHCHLSAGAPAWLHVKGAQAFNLNPGQSKTVPYTVTASQGQTGSGAVVATATLAKAGHGNGQISASAGSRVTLGTTACHVAQAPPTLPPSGQFSSNIILLPGIILALIVIVAVIWRTRRRHA